jgi:signal transduction histidine kinase
MQKPSIKRKLFLTLFTLGILNILLAYSFFYSSSISLLEERSGQQMESVRAQAAQKLKLYLDGLKSYADDDSKRIQDQKLKEIVTGLYVQDPDGKLKVIKEGKNKINPAALSTFIPRTFYPINSEEFLIKIPSGDSNVIWQFTLDGFNHLLEVREGMGESGEIYIVGKDHKIKSASRHLKDWKNTKVKNASILKGQKNKFGVHSVKDYRGVEVVSAYAPFEYDALKYVLLSEIDKAEVLLPLKTLFPRIFMICGALCLLTLLLAFYSTSKIVRLIEHMREQINNFNIKFINTIEAEKKKISYNLHDGLGQILTAIKWGISEQESPTKLKDLCDDAFKEIRTISNDLMPVVLSELGFFPALKEYLVKIENYYKFQLTYRFSDQLAKHRFKEGMDVNLYRMIQEFLHNSIKHGKCHSVSLVLLKEEEFLQLRYEDDGVGMADTEPMPRVLLYRTELMGATINRSKTKDGLVFLVQIPLTRLVHGSI